jgi:aryl-alcohol dehydrogenase-like predicted oxidoreductase
MAPLGRTDLDVCELCLGGNVFGWTADEARSRDVLDAYAAAGGNFIDTANSYLIEHGRSETIIGRWTADRGNRDEIVLATKVGGGRGAVRNLRAETIEREARASLERLQTDRIDLYYAHFDDEKTPLDETLHAFDELERAGKVRHTAVSNYSAKRLRDALETADRLGVRGYVALQTHYNLMERPLFEDELRDLAADRGLGVLPYFGLARGFLTGKYRAGERVDSPRAAKASAYVGEKGDRVLGALGEVAQEHDVPVAAVALRWLADQPTVVAPIASARNVEQLAELVPMTDLVLTNEQRQRLTEASD